MWQGSSTTIGQVAALDEQLRQQMLKIQQQAGATVAQAAGTFDLTPNGSWPIGGTGGVTIGKHGVFDTVTIFIPGETYALGLKVEQYTNVSGVITVLKGVHLAPITDITSDERAAGSSSGITRSIGPFEQNVSLGLLRLFAYDQQDNLIAANPDIETDTPVPASRQLADYLTTWNSSANQAVSNTGTTFFQLIQNGKFSKQDSDASGNTIANQLGSWSRRDSTTWATNNPIGTTVTDAIYWKPAERGVYWINKSDRLAEPIGRSFDNSEFISFAMFVTCGSTFAPTITPRLRDNIGTDILAAAYVIPITLPADTSEHYVAGTWKIDSAVTINKRVHVSFETTTVLSATNSIRFRKVGAVRGKEAVPWFGEGLSSPNGDSYYIIDGGAVKRPLQGSGEDEINGVVIPTTDIGSSPFDPDATGTGQGFVNYKVF